VEAQTLTLREEVLRLVQDLLRTPGALHVQVAWVEMSADGAAVPHNGRTFAALRPPSDVHQIDLDDDADLVTVYLQGHLSGSVPCSSVIGHINGKRLRVGHGPFPCSMEVVRSAAAGYLIRTADPIAAR